MSLYELEYEVRHRQAECLRTWAAVAGSAGKLQTERDHLVARVESARRTRRDYPESHDAEIDLAWAEHQLEEHDRAAMEAEGTCPDCAWPLGTEFHGDEPCGGEASCSLCLAPIDPLVDRTSPAPLCGGCEGTVRIDEERGT